MPVLIPVTRLDETPWAMWLSCSETQLFHINEPESGLFIAESPNVIERAMHAGYTPISFLIDRRQMNGHVQALLDASGEIPVYVGDADALNQVRGLHLTRGVLCAMRRRPQNPLAPDSPLGKRIAVLENIMNPTNLGAIFRSAAALGVDAVLLTSGCTDPLYRRTARVSMGTVFQVDWAYLPDAPDAAEAVKWLRSIGYRTAAMALSKDAVSIDSLQISKAEKLAIVLGTEGEGLAPETVRACDDVVCIPMANGVDSLNVAAASAVAFWQLRG